MVVPSLSALLSYSSRELFGDIAPVFRSMVAD